MLPRCHRYQISRHCIQFTGMYILILWIVAYSICKSKLSYFNLYLYDEWIWWNSGFWVGLLSLQPLFESFLLQFDKKCLHIVHYYSFRTHRPMIGEIAVFSCGIWQENFKFKNEISKWKSEINSSAASFTIYRQR